MLGQYRETYGEYNNWVLPLNLAVGFHLIIALSVLVLPDLFKSRAKHEDIYTVDLVNLSEPVIEQSAPPAPVPEPVAQPEPQVSEKAVAITDPVQPPPPQVKEVKPVSLKPSKRKIKKKIKDPQKDRQKDLERKRRQLAQEAARAEQLAAEQARIAAAEAERQRQIAQAELNRIRNQVRTSPTPRPSPGRGKSIEDPVIARYSLGVNSRLIEVWKLPEFKVFDESLLAIYVIVIARDGSIIDQFFEQKSNDPTYDQFVKRAVSKASPFQPFPAAIREKSLEFELKFRPGDIRQ